VLPQSATIFNSPPPPFFTTITPISNSPRSSSMTLVRTRCSCGSSRRVCLGAGEQIPPTDRVARGCAS